MTAAGVHSSAVPPAAVDALRDALLGEVLVAGDDGYDAARAVWNAMIDRRPALIARCKGTADVLDAVRFAREHGLPVSIRGGGHNVAGHAVAEGGLMVDLSAMRAVRVDPQQRRAWVEGGATWREVDRETQAFGLAVPGGLVSATGVAGLTLSGGIGWLRSRHGLSIDNLVAADVVTADGPPGPRQRDRAPRPPVGAQGRRRQLRRRHRVRVRPPPGRAHADVLRAALPAERGQRPDPVLARLPGRQERRRGRPWWSSRRFPATPPIRSASGASASTRSPRSTPVTPTRANGCCSPCASSASRSPTSPAR